MSNTNTNTNNPTASAPAYVSIRVETYTPKVGKGIRKFDGRLPEGEAKARAYANERYLAGDKVTVYRLTKTAEGEWVREDIGEADGRKPSEKKPAPKARQTKSATKAKPSAKTKSSERVAVPAPQAASSDLEVRIETLEKGFTAMAESLATLNSTVESMSQVLVTLAEASVKKPRTRKSAKQTSTEIAKDAQ